MASEAQATEVKQHFGRYLDDVQNGPITIYRNGRARAVLMSVEDYKSQKTTGLEALSHEFDRLAARYLMPAGNSKAASDALFSSSIDDLGAAHRQGFSERGF